MAEAAGAPDCGGGMPLCVGWGAEEPADGWSVKGAPVVMAACRCHECGEYDERMPILCMLVWPMVRAAMPSHR